MFVNNTYYLILLKLLEEIYPHREASNIAKIYFEDRFSIIFPQNKYALDNNFDLKIFNSDLLRFKKEEPLQYIVGKTFFYNNFFLVNKSVLIPRQETELLVYEAINSIRNTNNNQTKVLEIGVGSGCISLSIGGELTNLMIEGIDISVSALEIAKKNKERLKIVNVSFKVLDFLNKTYWESLGKYNLIVSNPPYIKESEKNLMSSSTIKYEPHIALFPTSENYLVFYEMILEFAKTHLEKNGLIILELNEYSENDIIKLISKYSYKWQIIDDLQGKPRLLKLNN